MNYQKIYNNLILKATNRITINEYLENHHIIPKCKGGTDEKENLVKLTGREHFLAHWLLHKIYPTDFNLLAAWNCFCRLTGKSLKFEGRVSSHLYQYCRLKWIKTLKERKITHPENYEKYIYSSLGTQWVNNGTVNKRIKKEVLNDFLNTNNEWILGRIKFKREKHSDDHIKKLKESFKRRKEQGLSNSRKGKKFSSEAELNGISKMVLARIKNGDFKSFEEREKFQKLKEQQKAIINITCPHCGKHGGKSIMKRWHFDRCKFQP